MTKAGPKKTKTSQTTCWQPNSTTAAVGQQQNLQKNAGKKPPAKHAKPINTQNKTVGSPPHTLPQ